jgi:hypothetical protein
VLANRHEHWEAEVQRCADVLELDLSEITILPKRDPRKLNLARQLYREIGAPASWICNRLSMGTSSNFHMLLAKD